MQLGRRGLNRVPRDLFIVLRSDVMHPGELKVQPQVPLLEHLIYVTTFGLEDP